MSEWSFQKSRAIFSHTPPERQPAPAERPRRPLAERIVRDATRPDALRGRALELSFPGGAVRVLDRSREARRSEYNGSTEFAPSQVRVDVSCRYEGDMVRVRVERLGVVMPKDVTVTYDSSPESKSSYGTGRTLREHEDAHVATGKALRNPSFVEDLFRGKLAYTSPTTGETVRFDGIAIPNEISFSASRTFPGKRLDVAATEGMRRAIDMIGQAAVRYLQDVISYVDDAENHGPPLPSDQKKTPYRTVGGKLSLQPPPKAPSFRSSF
ncbi:hypothetical protein EBS80_04545 [bacterium]|nr:hypothetical protein [bacterium]